MVVMLVMLGRMAVMVAVRPRDGRAGHGARSYAGRALRSHRGLARRRGRGAAAAGIANAGVCQDGQAVNAGGLVVERVMMLVCARLRCSVGICRGSRGRKALQPVAGLQDLVVTSIKHAEKLVHLGVAHAAAGEQQAQARILNGDCAGGLLHLQRGIDALLLVLVEAALHALDKLLAAGAGAALVFADALGGGVGRGRGLCSDSSLARVGVSLLFVFPLA